MIQCTQQLDTAYIKGILNLLADRRECPLWIDYTSSHRKVALFCGQGQKMALIWKHNAVCELLPVIWQSWTRVLFPGHLVWPCICISSYNGKGSLNKHNNILHVLCSNATVGLVWNIWNTYQYVKWSCHILYPATKLYRDKIELENKNYIKLKK